MSVCEEKQDLFPDLGLCQQLYTDFRCFPFVSSIPAVLYCTVSSHFYSISFLISSVVLAKTCSFLSSVICVPVCLRNYL